MTMVIDESALIEEVTWRMITFDKGDAKRIQHFLKVHRFAQLIASGELLDPATRTVVECAALVHDIGIHAAEEKYGSADGKHQEAEGPALAQALLGETALDEARCERICWLVGHHHTYAPVDGLDHQILLEADALVNLYEDQVPLEAVAQAKERLFRTETGRRLVTTMFGV